MDQGNYQGKLIFIHEEATIRDDEATGKNYPNVTCLTTGLFKTNLFFLYKKLKASFAPNNLFH